MRKLLAVLALAALAAACSEQTTEPASPAQESPQFGVVARNDSTVKAVFIRWTEGTYEYSVDFAEGSVDHAWMARVGY